MSAGTHTAKGSTLIILLILILPSARAQTETFRVRQGKWIGAKV